MYFSEQERKIYTPPNSDKQYDPIQLDRRLTVISNNRLDELITERNAVHDNLGDVSPEGRRASAINAARAELELASIARKAFDLPDFPECLDADALSMLYNFLEWMEGKGETVGKPQASPESFPESLTPVGMNPLLPST